MWIDSGIQRRELHRLYTSTVTKFRVRLQSYKLFCNAEWTELIVRPIVKLYKNNIIQHHQIFVLTHKFHTVKTFLFNYQYLEYAHTIACIDESHYHYRILGSGTLSSKFRPKQFDTDYQQWKILQSFYQRHHLWSSTAQTYLYKRLWGILYDGIFLYPRLQNKKISYLRTILAIPEIKNWKILHNAFRAAIGSSSPFCIGYNPYILYLFFNHCQKMKLLLYPHGGSGNHGCEAIVRSTLKMIPTATLFSSNPDEDKRYGLDAICTLRAAQAPMSHLSLAYWKAFIRYRFGDKEAFDRTSFRSIFSRSQLR